jgi:hypothetical protein
MKLVKTVLSTWEICLLHLAMLNQQECAIYEGTESAFCRILLFFCCFGEKITSRFLSVLRHREPIYRTVKQPAETESVYYKAAYLFVWKNCFGAVVEAITKRPGKVCDI